MSGLMGSRISMPCPICGRALNPTLEDVRQERTVWCPGGHQVRLVDQNDGIRKLDRQLDDFTRRMQRAGFKVTWCRR
jgi:hypothetical protein